MGVPEDAIQHLQVLIDPAAEALLRNPTEWYTGPPGGFPPGGGLPPFEVLPPVDSPPFGQPTPPGGSGVPPVRPPSSETIELVNTAFGAAAEFDPPEMTAFLNSAAGEVILLFTFLEQTHGFTEYVAAIQTVTDSGGNTWTRLRTERYDDMADGEMRSIVEITVWYMVVPVDGFLTITATVNVDTLDSDNMFSPMQMYAMRFLHVDNVTPIQATASGFGGTSSQTPTDPSMSLGPISVSSPGSAVVAGFYRFPEGIFVVDAPFTNVDQATVSLSGLAINTVLATGLFAPATINATISTDVWWQAIAVVLNQE